MINKNNIKMNIKKITIGIAIASFGFLFPLAGVSQSSNVVSAALEFKKVQTDLMKQDMKSAKEHLLGAKSLIDEALKHESTANDSKAHYYNVLICLGIKDLIALAPDDADFKAFDIDELKTEISNSIKVANTTRRWKGELNDYFNQQTSQASAMGVDAYNSGNYIMAFAMFASVYELKTIADIETDREDMRNNAVVSALNLIDSLKKEDNITAADEFISFALGMLPGSKRIAVEGVNISLEKGDLAKADEYFELVAKKSPDDKELFQVMGSIYLAEADKLMTEIEEMESSNPDYTKKKDDSESLLDKSEEYLKRSLSIDGNYKDALYSLGVLYQRRAEIIKDMVNQMNYNDPRVESLQKKSQEIYEKAIEPLEKYIVQDPENVNVLYVLFQVHHNAGNTEKALEYRDRAKKIQGE